MSPVQWNPLKPLTENHDSQITVQVKEKGKVHMPEDEMKDEIRRQTTIKY